MVNRDRRASQKSPDFDDSVSKGYDSVSNIRNYWQRKEVVSDSSFVERHKADKKSKIPVPSAVKDIWNSNDSNVSQNQRRTHQNMTGKVLA